MRPCSLGATAHEKFRRGHIPIALTVRSARNDASNAQYLYEANDGHSFSKRSFACKRHYCDRSSPRTRRTIERDAIPIQCVSSQCSREETSYSRDETHIARVVVTRREGTRYDIDSAAVTPATLATNAPSHEITARNCTSTVSEHKYDDRHRQSPLNWRPLLSWPSQSTRVHSCCRAYAR